MEFTSNEVRVFTIGTLTLQILRLECGNFCLQLKRALIRFAVTAFRLARRAVWRITKPIALGVHAVPLTAAGEVVLVRLTYGPGWRLPGGGRKKGEQPRDAMLRELREEIGLRSYSEIEDVLEFTHRPEHRRGRASLFLLRDVSFVPRQSLEIDEIRAFAIDALPDETTPLTRRLVALALERQAGDPADEAPDLSSY
jgi:8-oxo-dGTP pyrophosphatase MutT (NUDIX family)